MKTVLSIAAAIAIVAVAGALPAKAGDDPSNGMGAYLYKTGGHGGHHGGQKLQRPRHDHNFKGQGRGHYKHHARPHHGKNYRYAHRPKGHGGGYYKPYRKYYGHKHHGPRYYRHGHRYRPYRYWGHYRHYRPYRYYGYRSFNFYLNAYPSTDVYVPPATVQSAVAAPVATPVTVPEAGPEATCLQTREYQTVIAVGGREVPAYGTACLQPDGSWLRLPAQPEPEFD